jgi:sugar/nucleoside kinase (ribokinase family)
MNSVSPKFIFLGNLCREYIIDPTGKAHIDQPGGNLLYAVGGLAIWGEKAGLLARVGEDYPRAWLDDVAQLGFNIEGIRILPEAIDHRRFIAYDNINTRHTDHPVSRFARLGISFPKSLLGYRDTTGKLDSLTQLSPLSLRQTDLPDNYKYASAAHLCSMDYLTHSLMPALLRQVGLTTITLDPGSGYMNSSFWDHVPALLPGLTAFMPSEEQVRALFQGRSDDLWEMAEALSSYGCEIIVITRGIKGQLLYDANARTRYDIPAYPSRELDPTGVGDAFCGGFLAGYRKTYDSLQAVLYGNVSSSLVIEGNGPFYPIDTLPGLAKARLETLPEAVRRI